MAALNAANRPSGGCASAGRLVHAEAARGIEDRAHLGNVNRGRRPRVVAGDCAAAPIGFARRRVGALALKTAWLCLRRSIEVRALTRDQIKPLGFERGVAKPHKGEAQKVGLIEWSAEPKATIEEAPAIGRRKPAASWLGFGNLSGQRCTKGGWKKTLAGLMRKCVLEARRRGLAFRPFSLQDGRPEGVTGKLQARPPRYPRRDDARQSGAPTTGPWLAAHTGSSGDRGGASAPAA
jgi:hypothetical protein